MQIIVYFWKRYRFQKGEHPLPTDADRAEQLQSKTRDLKRALGALGDIFPGSLLQRFRKCGKPTCHCAKKNSPGHGPDWVVTREVQGKTTTRAVPDEVLEQVRAGTEEYKRFRQLSHDLVEASAQLGEIRLKETGSVQDIKKNRTRQRVRH